MRSGGSWGVVRGVAWRVIHNGLTNPSLLVPSLLFPLFFFTAFAGGLSAVSGVPGFDYPPGYTTFQFAFVLLQASAFNGVFSGFGIARDFEYGFSKRLLLAAPHRQAIVAGYALGALGRVTATWALLTVAAFAAGVRVLGGPVDLVGLFTLAVLVNLCGGFWAAGVALRVRSIQGGPLMQMPVFLTLFLAPVFVPLDLLEGWIHTVATYNPATYLIEGARGLLAGDPADVAAAFTIAAGLVALLAVWALRGMRKAEAAG